MASGPRITSRELNAVLPGGFGGAVGGFGLFPENFQYWKSVVLELTNVELIWISLHTRNPGLLRFSWRWWRCLSFFYFTLRMLLNTWLGGEVRGW